MKLIMLLQEQHKPIPPEIESQIFGRECILPEEGEPIVGKSVYLSGPKEVFIDWLKNFDGIWISNNPMMGAWRVVHIKEELANAAG